MNIKKLPRHQVAAHERNATDLVMAIAASLGSERDKRSSEARYRAVVDAWNAVRHIPISNRILRTVIARAFGFDSQESVWRIVSAHEERTTGKAQRKSLGGYDKTWERIAQKATA